MWQVRCCACDITWQQTCWYSKFQYDPDLPLWCAPLAHTHLVTPCQKHSNLIGFILAGSCPLHLTGFQTDSLYLVQHISCFAFLPPTPLGFQTLQAINDVFADLYVTPSSLAADVTVTAGLANRLSVNRTALTDVLFLLSFWHNRILMPLSFLCCQLPFDSAQLPLLKKLYPFRPLTVPAHIQQMRIIL